MGRLCSGDECRRNQRNDEDAHEVFPPCTTMVSREDNSGGRRRDARKQEAAANIRSRPTQAPSSWLLTPDFWLPAARRPPPAACFIIPSCRSCNRPILRENAVHAVAIGAFAAHRL